MNPYPCKSDNASKLVDSFCILAPHTCVRHRTKCDDTDVSLPDSIQIHCSFHEYKWMHDARVSVDVAFE
jgi:hypothetical protein